MYYYHRRPMHASLLGRNDVAGKAKNANIHLFEHGWGLCNKTDSAGTVPTELRVWLYKRGLLPLFDRLDEHKRCILFKMLNPILMFDHRLSWHLGRSQALRPYGQEEKPSW